MDKIQNFNSPVAENIIRIINQKGFIQKRIAEKSGFTPQGFNDVLCGRRILKISETKNIAIALDVEINDLFKSDQRS